MVSIMFHFIGGVAQFFGICVADWIDISGDSEHEGRLRKGGLSNAGR